MTKSRKVNTADVAAYLLDRADQYDTDSGCWVALVEAARNIMAGNVETAKRNGDLDASLYARLQTPVPPPDVQTALADALLRAVADMHHEHDEDEEHEIPAQTRCGACGEESSPCTDLRCWVPHARAALRLAGRLP